MPTTTRDSIALNDRAIEALYGYGTAATHLDIHLDLAEKALLGANQRAPQSAEIAKSLAKLGERQQKPEEMMPYLKQVIRNARDLEMRRWAAETYLQTEKSLDEHKSIDAQSR